MVHLDRRSGRTALPSLQTFIGSDRFTDEQCVTKRLNMFGWLNFLENLNNTLIRADDERGPFRAEVFFAVHAFFHPDMVGMCQSLFRVAQERERKAIFLNEFLVAFDGIDAHAK
jgi:hypothetical protein